MDSDPPKTAPGKQVSKPAVPAELRVKELELKLAALRTATANMQQGLIQKNAALSAEVGALQATAELNIGATDEDVERLEQEIHFQAARAQIETKIARRLTAFYTDIAEQRIKALRTEALLATPINNVASAQAELSAQWTALAKLLMGVLLTESGRVVDPISQRRLKQARATLERSGLFDKAWYLDQYPDISESGLDPVDHYLRHGAREGRLPSGRFQALDLDKELAAKAATGLRPPQTLAEVLTGGDVWLHGELAPKARPDAERIAKAAKASISVIVPTYNRATTIVRAVRSALDQTLSPSEVIVADDQSTDHTLVLLEEEFAAEIGKGQLIVLPCEKGGVCKMRNEALAVATGDVIAYLDSDNFWHPDHLLWAQAALAQGGAISVYTAANIHHLTEHWSRVDSTPYDRTQMLSQNFIDLNCFVHQAALYHQHGGFDTNLTRLVDWDYIIRLTRDAAALRVPVATVEYFLDKTGLANISFVSSLEENATKIQIKHRAEMRAHGILNANAERKLDAAAAAAAAKMRGSAAPVAIAPPTPAPAPVMAQTGAGQLPYFGGLNLFVVLPTATTPTDDLPVAFLNARWIVLDSEGRWSERRPDGSMTAPHTGLPSGNYWCPDLRQPMPSPHQLATLTAATQLTQIDMAVASYTLDAPPVVGVSCFRNQVVLRDPLVEDFVRGRAPAVQVVGKVLRIPEGPQDGIRMQDLSVQLGRAVTFAKDGQYFGFDAAPSAAAMRPQRKPATLPKAAPRPRVLVLAQKLAVGGVERNTIEVARQLQDSHECLYLTLEKIYPEQGSLCHQATEVCAQTLDLAEIAHHDLYLPLLTHLNAVYAPDALWICNGSMWLSANADKLRGIFEHCGIVDQQVYDVEAGWINHYQKPGIQSFDRFIAINRKIHEKFIQGFGMDPARIDLIYSAINAQRFHDARAARADRHEMRELYGLPQDKKLFVFMGRLVEQKRPLDFLEVAWQSRSHKHQHFVLVGNGVLAPEVEAWLDQHKPDNITWIKNVADTTQFWPAVDAYMVMSSYEGLPIALIEAISFGVPVVATDVGDIRYVLDKYTAGTVVDKIGDPALFASTLQDYVPQMAAIAEALKDRGGEIIDFFSAETISGQFADSFAKAQNRVKRGAR